MKLLLHSYAREFWNSSSGLGADFRVQSVIVAVVPSQALGI